MSPSSLGIIFNAIGLIASLLFLTAYFLLQRGTLADHDPRYLWMNLFGSIASVVSLLWFWNLPVLVIEFIWGFISIYGLVKAKSKAI